MKIPIVAGLLALIMAIGIGLVVQGPSGRRASEGPHSSSLGCLVPIVAQGSKVGDSSVSESHSRMRCGPEEKR